MSADIIGLFPQWYVPNFGTGYIVALISATHVFFSHLSVGASFLLAYLFYKAYKHNDEEIYHFIHRYFFILLLTSYIIGSLTGPGIWYSTTVSAPRGTSALIHNFVWVWASEELWFISEVMLVYILYYAFNKVDRRTFMHWTWAFAFISWGTMLLIVGILSFMMTPGSDEWFKTGNVLQAFYNPNYFPHVLMRSALMLALAALMGLAVAKHLSHEERKQEIVRELSLWGIGGLLAGGMFLVWYIATLPDRALESLNMVIPWQMELAIALTIAVLLIAFVVYYFFPRVNRALAPLVVMMLVVLALAIFPSERIREWLRKPYIAGDFMYVNQVIARDVPGRGMHNELPLLNEEGFLKAHPFVPEKLKTITPENVMEAGHAMAMIACANCHSLDENGPRPLVKKMEGVTNPGVIYQFLNRRMGGDPNHGQAPYMPVLAATDQEKRALALYLAELNREHLARLGEPVPADTPTDFYEQAVQPSPSPTSKR